jgi:hypothetical protein
VSCFESSNGDIWDGDEVIPADPQTPHERDQRLMLAVRQVGQVLAKLMQAYEVLGDLSAVPGTAGLRAAANSTHRLAVEMQACAEDIDNTRSAGDRSIPR